MRVFCIDMQNNSKRKKENMKKTQLISTKVRKFGYQLDLASQIEL